MKGNSNLPESNDQNVVGLAPARLPPRLWQVIVIGLVAIIFTAGWLYFYIFLGKVIWLNSYVTQNKWLIPVVTLFFSLVVGLTLKYLHSPSVLQGGFVESIKGEGGVMSDYRTFPGTLLASYASLLSGVSVGPEGPLAFLVQEIAAWTKEKFKIHERSSLAWTVAALASAYNGIIGNPLFTALFATEFQVGGSTGLTLLVWNLVAGTIGYLFFTLLNLTVFANSIPFVPITGLKIEYIAYAVLLGLVGTILATLVGAVFQMWGKIMGWIFKVFKNSVIVRILIAGAITGFVCYFYPEIQFSGENQIQRIISDPASYGVGLLILLAILKILMLGLAFKSGYLGGPIFPILFSSTMIALALSLVFPDIPLSIFVTCIEAAVVALVLGVPLTAILLVAVVNTWDTYTVGLMVIAVVTAMISGSALKRYLARLAAKAVTTPIRD